ncbi:MAG: ATP-binding protein [Pelovirga sp.]
MRRELYQEILLEIALSISGEFDLDKLLKKCLPLFQRKLNCLFSGVYSETEGALDLERVLPTAIRSSDRYRWAHAELLRVHAEGNTESLVVISHDGVHLYLMNLLGFGRLLLCRATAFDPYFLKELLPLAPMLARACTSCQEVARRREIEASLETKVRERTAELLEVNDKVRQALEQSTRAEAEAQELARQNSLLLQSISEGFYGVDMNGLTTFVNPAAAKMLGFESAELLGRPIHQLTHHTRIDGTEYRADDCPVHQQVIKQGQTVSKVADVYWRKDGTCFPVEYHSAPIREGDRISGAVVVFTDITERNILEQQLLQAQKMEAIGQLAAGVAHEINTPLQYIQNNTAFLKSSVEELTDLLQTVQELTTVTPPAREEKFERIVSAASACDLDFLLSEVPSSVNETLDGISHIVKIVSAMKEFSHSDHRDMVPTDINALIDTAVVLSKNEWKYVATLTTDFDPALPLLDCHPGSWRQLILNLIVNSAHAIEPVAKATAHSGRIIIRTRLVENDVELSVEDNGTGMTPEVRERIFEPFFTTKEVGKGTGQGLAIVYDLVVNKHQGNITCDSEPGKGCRLTINIPLANNT